MDKTGHSPPSGFSIQLDEGVAVFVRNALLAAQEIAQLSVQLLAGFFIPHEWPCAGLEDADPIGEPSPIGTRRDSTVLSVDGPEDC